MRCIAVIIVPHIHHNCGTTLLGTFMKLKAVIFFTVKIF